MYRYTVFGLDIESAVPMPAVCREGGASDVKVRFGRVKVADTTVRLIEEGKCHRASPHEALLSWPDVGAFHIRAGREVIVDSRLKTDPHAFRACLLGPVFAVLLHQRGRLVLHASAVSIAGGTVGFVGCPGSGKSTMAVTLRMRGWPIVTDDLLACDVGPTQALTYSGFAELRLWPRSVEFLGDTPEALSRVHPLSEKRTYPIQEVLSRESLPLRRLYLLDQGPQAKVERVERQAAFRELIRHTFTAGLLDQTRAPGHFLQCVNLAAQVAIRRLVVPRSFEALQGVAALVEQDVATVIP